MYHRQRVSNTVVGIVLVVLRIVAVHFDFHSGSSAFVTEHKLLLFHGGRPVEFSVNSSLRKNCM